VVDGYLVLAPEGGAEAAGSAPSGLHRVRVEQGALELDFPGAEAVSPPPGTEARLDVGAQAADLIACLTDDSIAARRAAAEGLLDLAAAGQSAALLPYLQNGDPKVRSLVAGVLGEAGAVDRLPEIARLAEDPDPTVRACVMYAFARFGEKAAGCIDQVRRRLSDADSSARAGAVEALAAVLPRSEGAAEEAVNLTADPEPIVRQAASSATFAFALRGVAGPLMELLGDFSRRAQALEVLQQADDAVLWRLLVAFRNSSSGSAQAALDILSYVMSRRWTADDFREELESPDAEARLAGLEGLSMVGGPEAASLVRRLADGDPSPEVRRRAAEVLAQWQVWAGETAPARSDTVRTEV
jgi:HEAT repeat protein